MREANNRTYSRIAAFEDFQSKRNCILLDAGIGYSVLLESSKPDLRSLSVIAGCSREWSNILARWRSVTEIVFAWEADIVKVEGPTSRMFSVMSISLTTF